MIARRPADDGTQVLAAGALALAALVLGPPTLLLAWLAAHVLGTRRGVLALCALAGAAATAALAPRLRGAMHATAAALHRLQREPASAALAGVAPHAAALWLETIPLAPLVALGLILHRDGAVARNPDERARRAQALSERRAVARARPPAEPPNGRNGNLFLGHSLGGDRLLPIERGRVYLPLERLGHHLLVVGATGSGKTETVLRLTDSVAQATDWTIVYLDGKGDREAADRFGALMAAAGRRTWRFPAEAYDGWRGDGAQIAGRLLQLVDFAESGGGTYYRDLAVNAIQLACTPAAGPPRSSVELLRRLRREALAELHPAGSLAAAEVAGLGREQINGIRARYAAFFATVGSSLDGATGLEQVDCASFLLDGLALKHESGYLARFLVEEFTQWAAVRKPRSQRVLLVVDEFSAIAAAGKGLVDVVERMRVFGVAAVLCPQVAEGMGSPEASARLIGSARTILLHGLSSPERFTETAGSRLIESTTQQIERDRFTGFGSSRLDREPRVDPDEVRRLRPGQCFAIGAGLALKMQVAPIPPSQPRPPSLRS